MSEFLTVWVLVAVVSAGLMHDSVRRSGGWSLGRVARFLLWGPPLFVLYALCTLFYHYDRLRARLSRRR